MKVLAPLLLALAVLGTAGALAAPPREPDGEPPAEARAELEHRAHLVRLVEIADALGLPDDQVLKLRGTLDAYDRQWRPLHDELERNVHIIKAAAHGDAAALDKLDAALPRARALREQIQQLDVALFDKLSQGLDRQKKARLAVVLAHLPWEMHDLFHAGHERRPPGP